MQFLVTQYIAELPEPLPLYPRLGYTLDNPRSEVEINDLAHFLWRIIPDNWKGPYSDPSTDSLESFIDRFHHTARASSDGPYPAAPSELSLRKLVPLLVVLRYEDHRDPTECEFGPEPSEEQLDAAAHSYEMLEVRLIAYSALLSLLVHSEGSEYYGSDLTFPTGVTGPADEEGGHFVYGNCLAQLAWANKSDHAPAPSEEWRYWRYVREPLLRAAHLLSAAMNAGDEDMLLYAGDVLRAVRDTGDPRFKIALLVSAIEMLITHNPDFKRFNVEDSITKQFVLKTIVLLRMNGAVDLPTAKATLTQLYRLRSAIAHGDFNAIPKILGRPNDEREALDTMVSATYEILRVVMHRHTEDPPFVRFLKDN